MALQSIGSNTTIILSDSLTNNIVYAVFTTPKVVKVITYATTSTQQENFGQGFYWG